MKILIKNIGFIGDNLFSSSVAKKLKEKYPNCTVDYLLTVAQPYELLLNDPYINNVYLLIFHFLLFIYIGIEFYYFIFLKFLSNLFLKSFCRSSLSLFKLI